MKKEYIPRPNRKPKHNLIGSVIHRLTVIGYRKKQVGVKLAYSAYLCRCRCGEEGFVTYQELMKPEEYILRTCKCLDYVESIGLRKAFNMLRNSAKHRHKGKTIVMTLTFDDFRFLTGQSCVYCGLPPGFKWFHFTGQGRYPRYMPIIRIDRVDSSKPYELGNVCSCCWICNRAKNVMSLEDFFAWVRKVHNHNFGGTNE